MEIEGVDKVVAQLELLKKQSQKDNNKSAVVGYTQQYALFVHENLTAHHKEGKQAKFLEGPARRLAPELARIVTAVYQQTNNLGKALLAAALRLQRESQQVVPIDTGALKASAFSALKENEETAAAAAYARSQALKQRVTKHREKKLKTEDTDK